MRVESDLFWLCAIVQLLVSLRVVALVRQLDKAHVTAKIIKLTSGQRQDSWLASGVIWAMILCKGSPYSSALFYVGSIALVWLIVRACQRANVVVKARYE